MIFFVKEFFLSSTVIRMYVYSTETYCDLILKLVLLNNREERLSIVELAQRYTFVI